MGNGYEMVLKLEIQRLDIFRKVGTGCRITDVADPRITIQFMQNSRGKNISDESLTFKFLEICAVICGYAGAFLSAMLECVQGVVELDRYTASIDDANDTTHGATLMCWNFWSLCSPLVAAHFGASAKTAGRALFFLGVERDFTAPPAGDMGKLVHLSH